MKNFENKVVVITGAGSGIGRALALAFQQSGAKLAINDNNETALLETVNMQADPKMYFTGHSTLLIKPLSTSFRTM